MANPSTGRVKTLVTCMTYSITRAEEDILVSSKRRILFQEHVYEWLGWPENMAPQSCVWYLAAPSRQPCRGLALAPCLHTSAPERCGLLPACTPCLSCSGHGHSRGAVRNQPLNLQRCLLQPTLVIHKYDFTLGTKSQIPHKTKHVHGGTGFASVQMVKERP